MSRKRVVITGVGLVTPLGCGSENVWKRLVQGDCGLRLVKKISDYKTSVGNEVYIPEGCSVSVAGFVPRSSCDEVPDESLIFDESRIFGRSVSKEFSPFIQYALFAAELALKNANLYESMTNVENAFEIDKSRFGTAIASGGIGSLQDIHNATKTIEKSYKKLSPYFVPKILINMAAGQVSVKYGLKGPVHSVATACAAGSHSIGDAYNFIRLGYADVMLAGGSEASIDTLSISGFARMNALSKKTDPSLASSPFDKDRDGFVIGEGAGILVVEELTHALARNAPIIAEVCGYALSGDGHHATSPTGEGARRAMANCLAEANIQASDVDYINAHATSTPLGDTTESDAIDAVFSRGTQDRGVHPLYVSSCKGAMGHLLGAAGAVESAFTALAVRDSIVPLTLNLVHADPAAPASFTHVKGESIFNHNMNYAMKNSFGFGGTNATLIFGKYPR